ncbi:MAG: DUF2835 domain-containing protein [Oceanicoccus sp.]
MTDKLIVDVTITATEYLKNYQVPGAVVSTQSCDGRRVRFPANILQPFVTHNGIDGRFAIEFDQQAKFKSIIKLGD